MILLTAQAPDVAVEIDFFHDLPTTLSIALTLFLVPEEEPPPSPWCCPQVEVVVFQVLVVTLQLLILAHQDAEDDHHMALVLPRFLVLGNQD